MNQLIRRGLSNASYIVFGNILAQVISLLGFVYIAVKLGTQDFGIYSIVLSFVAIFAFINFSGLDRVHMIEGSKDPSNLKYILSNNLPLKIFACISSLIICTLFSFATPYNSETRILIGLFSFSLLFTGIISYCTSILQANEKMGRIAFLRVFRSTLFILLAVWFLYSGYGLRHVIISQLFSVIVISILFYFYSKKLANFSYREGKGIMKKYIRPAFVYTGVNFCGLGIQRADILILSIIASLNEVGIYALVLALVSRGVQLRNMIAMGFSPAFIKEMKSGTPNIFLYSYYSFIILILFSIPCFIFAFFSENIVIFLFTDIYQESSVLIKYSIFAIPLSFATIPFTLLMQSTKNESVILHSNICMLITQVVLNVIFYIHYGLIGICYSSLVAYSVALLFYPIRGLFIFNSSESKHKFIEAL